MYSILVIGNWGAPADQLQEIYVDTCQASCGLVNHHDEADECREKFCPNYSSYLLTGFTLPDSSPSFVSSQHKEVADFCATWMIHLLEELGWQRRIHLHLKECTCAGNKDCLVK